MSHPIHHLDITHHQYVSPEVIVNNVSINPLRSIAPIFYQCISINSPLNNLQESFKETDIALHYHWFDIAPQWSILLKQKSNHIHIGTCIKLRSTHRNWMISPLKNIPAIHDTTLTTTYGVILSTLWRRLAREEDKYWTHEFIHQNWNRFIYTWYPIWYEDFLHLTITRKNHLS